VSEAGAPSDGTDALLTVSDLRAGYGKLTILRDLSFEMAAGDIVSIVGPNGAGKSTLMNVLGGLLDVQAGTIQYDGAEITDASADQRVSLGISLVPERRHLFRNMTVVENLLVGKYRNREGDRDRLLAELYDIFPRLEERTDQKAGTLSGGEAQMLTIGRSLMNEPDLLLLDEPTIGLAPSLIPDLFEAIRTINDRGVSVVLVEQRVEESLGVADYGYLIENGAFALRGPAPELLEDETVVERYLGQEEAE